MTPVLAASIATTALVLYGLLALAVQPISLTSHQLVGFAPLNVRAEVRIEKHADNRQACLELDGAMYLDGCWPLDGATARVAFTRWWTDLPSGQYHGQARVQRGRDTVYSNVLTIRVLGDEP